MRYVKPEANELARFAVKFIPAADYAGGVLITLLGLGSMGFAIPMAILVSPWFSVFGLLSLFFLHMYVAYFKQTDTVGEYSFHRDDILDAAYDAWAQVRGEFTEQLALPLVQKVYDHAVAGGHGYYRSECRAGCNERVKVLKQLIPETKNINNKQDIQDALDFIQARKEIGS